MDSTQRKRIIAPLTGIDAEYAAQSLTSYVVAKQDKIGDLTPIIFDVSGDDYGSLIYALLDKNDKPISGFLLDGGPCGGPEIDTDTLLLLCPYRTSTIKGNTIYTQVVHVYLMPKKDSLATIDSISYKTEINNKGQMKTLQIDSIRYSNLRDKRWY